MINSVEKEISSYNFKGDEIYTCEHDGAYFVDVKRICESIGIQWKPQKIIIKKHYLLSEYLLYVGNRLNNKDAKMLMLNQKFIQGWVFSLVEKGLKASACKKLSTYQMHFHETVEDYWLYQKEKARLNQTEEDILNQGTLFMNASKEMMIIHGKEKDYATESVQMTLVFQYLYNAYSIDKAEHLLVDENAISQSTHINVRMVSSMINLMDEYGILVKKVVSEGDYFVSLNRTYIETILLICKSCLGRCLKKIGFLSSHIVFVNLKQQSIKVLH
ncbi:MAG: phage antirepressor N-terminal domain-containing protein [Methylococcaceae bacterium]